MTGKGKSPDLSTTWSEWAWDNQRGFWYSSRRDSRGELEWKYSPPSEQTTEVPRTFGSNVTSSTDTQHGYPSRDSSLPIITTYQGASINTTNSGSSSNYTTTSPAVAKGSGYSVATTNYCDTFSSQLAGLNLGGSSARDLPSPSSGSKSLYHPRKTDSYAGYTSATLDARYQPIPDNDPHGFWQRGRVFVTVWIEPARNPPFTQTGGPRDNNSQYSTAYLNTDAYSEVRRFVVISSRHGSSICSPVHTYGGQATLKPNLPDANQHTIIHTSAQCPAPHSYVAEGGQVIREELHLDPIKVNSETSDPLGQLSDLSRLNFSKVYTVEHFVKVVNIGMVDSKSMRSLGANSYLVPDLPAPQRPKILPPNSSSKQSKGSGSSRHSKSGRHHRSGQ